MRTTFYHSAMVIMLLLLCALVPGDEFTVKLQDELNSYYRNNAPLKLYLFYNQPAYSPGDTIFYRATLVTAAQHKFVGGRVVVDVRLFNGKGHRSANQVTLLKDGIGDGYIVTADTVKAGLYTLEACDGRSGNDHAGLCYRGIVELTGTGKFQPVTTVGFFPEGGKLVSGVPNRIVVQAGANYSGAITSETGRKVADFSCNESGLGTFYMSPEKSMNYFFTDVNGNKSQLPMRAVEGINLMATGFEKGDHIRTVIQQSSDAGLDGPVYLVVWNQNTITWKAEINLKRKNGVALQIPKVNVFPGLNGMTLFSNSGEVLSERLFYLSERSVNVDIDLEKEVYLAREQISVKIALDSSLLQADLAVSVFQSDLFPGKSSGNNAQNFFGLLSETNPEFVSPMSSPADIDMFLISQRWKRFTWDDIRKGTVATAGPLQTNLVFRGNAVFSESGQPVPDSTMLVFMLQKNIMTYETFTRGGQFSCPLLMDYFGEESVFYQAYYNGERLEGVKVLRSEERGPIQHVKENSIPHPYSKFAADRRDIQKIFARPGAKAGSEPVNWANEILNFVGGADVSITLKDYTMFPTMRETIHEIVPDLKVRRNKNGDFVRIVVSDLHAESKADPIYIVDGVFTDDTDFFLKLKPADVVAIHLINRSTKLEKIGLVQHGVVIVETSLPVAKRKVPVSESVFAAPGLNVKLPGSGMYSLKRSPRTPDIRSNVFWRPRVWVASGEKTDLRFILPDNTGTYRIVVDGVTTDGKPVHAEKEFNVVFAK
jgi:hypothetical protein